MKRLFLILLVIFSIQSAIAQNTLDKLGLTSTNQATVAYSLRLLSSSYTGPLVRVNVNGLFYDVYPDGLTSNFTLASKISDPYTTFNAVSTGATSNSLSTISSGNTATVAIWYDQSGNGTNLTQAITNYQPRIVNNGAIDLENNVPIIRWFGGTVNSLDLPSAITANPQVFVVNKFFGTDGFILGSKNDYNWHSNAGNAKLFDNSNASGSIRNSIIYQNGNLVSAANAVWNTALTVNNIAPQDPSNGTAWDNIGVDRVYHNTTSGAGYAELIVFNTALSNSSRITLESNQSSYFSITYYGGPRLSSLTSSGGTLSPPFDVSTSTYNLDVYTPSITVTPTTNLADNTILVNGNSVASGTASAAIALNTGNNVITIKVILADGITSKDYTLNVNKLLSTTLSNFDDLTRYYFDSSFELTAPTSNSLGSFSYTSSNNAVATVSGTTVNLVGAGVTTITANQVASGGYESKSIAMTLTVKQPEIITKNGKVSKIDINYVNKNGGLSGSWAVDKNGQTAIVKTAGSGLSSANPGKSAYQIKQDYPNSTDGLYWIKNSNINGGAPFQIYADMTTDGGGWTLIMKNSSSSGWTPTNAISLNNTIPFTNTADVISTSSPNYSIIAWADYLKKSESGFQYMIDATTRGSFGGIWTANGNYSFIKEDNSQTDITLDIKFGTWNYVNDNGISKRMPWYQNACGTITTDNGGAGNWWGALISICGWSPAPWIYDGGGGAADPDPGIIWYWVR